jgi:hypothetical protein
MRLDLTTLTAGQIALLTVAVTVIGSIIVAAISAIAAFITALVNARTNRRLDYLKVVRTAKAEQLEQFRVNLALKIRVFMAVRAGSPPIEAMEDLPLDEPAFLPVFVVVDQYAQRLTRLANKQQKAVFGAMNGISMVDPLPDETIKEVDKLVQIYILLNHFIEVFALQDTADPVRYTWRLRVNAAQIFEGVYGPIPPELKTIRSLLKTGRFWFAATVAIGILVQGYVVGGIGGVSIAVIVAFLVFQFLVGYLQDPQMVFRVGLITAFLILTWLTFKTWNWRPI